MHLHLHSEHKIARKPLLAQLNHATEAKDEQAEQARLKSISESVGAKFNRPAYDRPVEASAPWMRRMSFRMWTEAEDTYNKVGGTPAAAKIPEVSSPQVTSPMSPRRMQRPRVTRSKLLLRTLSLRNTLETSPNASNASGYASDNEEEEEEESDKLLVESKQEDEALADLFSCELCGRSVPTSDTTLVESRQNEEEKVRICEVCLYETDSEDEHEEEHDELLDGFHADVHAAIPAPTTPLQKPDDAMMVVKSINNLLDGLNLKNNSAKQELLKIQQRMQKLLQ